jgi:hypothetical protein
MYLANSELKHMTQSSTIRQGEVIKDLLISDAHYWLNEYVDCRCDHYNFNQGLPRNARLTMELETQVFS